MQDFTSRGVRATVYEVNCVNVPRIVIRYPLIVGVGVSVFTAEAQGTQGFAVLRQKALLVVSEIDFKMLDFSVVLGGCSLRPQRLKSRGTPYHPPSHAIPMIND